MTTRGAGKSTVDTALARPDLLEEARKVWNAHGWASVDEMISATAVIRAQQIIVSRMDVVLRPHGLSYSRFELLIILHASKTGALPLGKVSERLMVHPTSVTGLVDRLVKDGLVVRVPSQTDRRGVMASITDKGRRMVEEVAPQLSAVKFGFDQVGTDGARRIADAIRPLRRGAGDFDAD